MELKVQIKDKYIHFKIHGSVDTEGGTKLSNEFAEITEKTPLKNSIFDLSEVPTITSAGIGKLLKFYKYFDKLGGDMKIKGISKSLKNQFEEIHLDMIIPIEE